MRKLSLLGLAVMILAMAGCKGKKAEEVAEQKLLVKVSVSTKAEVEQLVEFTGTIEPYVQNVISPSAPVRIDQILVDVGDRVQKGQLVVKMDQTQYNTAKVQIANIEADYERLMAVYEVNGIPKQQVDAQFTQLEIARENIENLLENIELRSPITGVVTGRYYDPGDMYMMSPTASGVTGILTVMQMDRLKIKINVSEQYFPSIKTGMQVDIKPEIFPEETFTGKISLVYPAIDPSTRTFTVEITIPNGNMKLRPGMFTRVALNFGTAEHVMIADLAVQKQVGSSERYVYVISDSVARRRTVNVGRQIGSQYEVLDGVEEGEELVVAGMSRLVDGTEVEITNE